MFQLSTDNNLSLDSDDDFRSGCRNVSHHYRQQSFSGLRSPGRSNYTIKRKFVAYFAKFRKIRVFIKRPRREKSRESPSQINLIFVFFFPSLLCALFLQLFSMNFGFRFNSCSQFRKMTFPANFKSSLSRDLLRGSTLRFIRRRHDRMDTRVNEMRKL